MILIWYYRWITSVGEWEFIIQCGPDDGPDQLNDGCAWAATNEEAAGGDAGCIVGMVTKWSASWNQIEFKN